MPKPQLITASTVEVELDPALQLKLLQELKVYEALKAEAEENAEMLGAMKARIESIREECGAKKIHLPGGYGVTRVDGGTSTTLAKKKVYALGISKAQLDACYTTKPKKPHTLVILPGDEAKAAKAKAAPRDERDEDGDDE